MASPADPRAWAAERARVLARLKERLEAAAALSDEVRVAIGRSDISTVEGAVSRIETLAQEYKLLGEEYRRLDRSNDGTGDDSATAEAREALRATTQRVARSAAVTGGVLERMVAVSQGLLSVIGSAVTGGTYLPTGRAPDLPAEGLRLRGQA